MKILHIKNNARTFLVLFLLVASQATLWMLASPLLSGPDEPSHIVTAAADIRGELVKPRAPHFVPAFQVVTVPETFALTRDESQCLYISSSQPGNCKLPAKLCLKYTGNVNATCGLPLLGSGQDTSAITQSGRYPPVYSLITGLPSIISTRPGTIYFMRLMGVLLGALYVALALYSVYRWSSNPLMIAGIAITLTPMAVYLMAVVNPSGFEISSALCLWVSGMVLISERFKKIPVGLLNIIGFSCFGLILARPDSPLLAILVVLILGLMAEPSMRKLLRASRHFIYIVGVIVITWVIAMAWIIGQNASLVVPGVLYPVNSSAAHIAQSVLGSSSLQLNQMIGVLGWNNAPVPLITLLIWYCGLGYMIVLGLSGMSRRSFRKSLAFFITLGAVIVIPLVYTLRTAASSGYILQGRYIYPVAIGLIIIAATLANQVTARKLEVTKLLLILMAIGNVFAFIWVLRRYMVGLSTLDPFKQVSGKWSPPIPFLLLISAYVVVNILSVGALFILAKTISARKGLVSGNANTIR